MTATAPDDKEAVNDRARLIETAFPLKQASIDSVHEKNVRHGHISTLHIWPARRPLAACRAALIATLLTDPGTPEERNKLCEKIGGKVIKVIRKKNLPNGKVEEREVDETVGGILHWGRETDNKAELDWFRDEIKKAYGGRAPRVLDPFAGGGAIPLEAMRLGCEATAIDINPVAWFILKCTLEYPQKLAGQKRTLPKFILKDREFMQDFFKAHGFRPPQVRTFLKSLGFDGGTDEELQMPGFGFDRAFLEADLAWHVRAWGRWVLAGARKDLAEYYPVYSDFQALKEGGKAFKPRPMQPVSLKGDGTPDIESLNREFEAKTSPTSTTSWLEDPLCPRWVAKPAVAYLWARTVKCKNCRAAIPLLKTRWLAKKGKKRVLLGIEPNSDKSGVVFAVETDVPQAGGNNAVRREHDRSLGQGTMSRAGAWCPCCGKPGTVAMEMEDIRAEGLAGRLDQQMTAVVVDGPDGKEYRLPTATELAVATPSEAVLERVFAQVPFGIPDEPMPGKDALGIRVPLYGFDRWRKMFTNRQLLALGTVVKWIRGIAEELSSKEASDWASAILALNACVLSKLLDYENTGCSWYTQNEQITHLFNRFALPIKWDFAEASPIGGASGSWRSMLHSVAKSVDSAVTLPVAMQSPRVEQGSAITYPFGSGYDLVLTDPPYYDAIPYSDLMDFFYIWLRRALSNTTGNLGLGFRARTSPKWDVMSADGELIDDASRHGNDAAVSKGTYEHGMASAFQASAAALSEHGRLVVVFANKQPDAWETLVAAIIRAGFTVDASWPIQTEMSNRTRAISSAALASSVWLVCRKREAAARAGWDNAVLSEMRIRINTQLHSFWDAGIRGPDFVWAATGPALEVYSKHPIVKKADKSGELMNVSEFLRAVRRFVVDFVVGRVLSEATHTEADEETISGLDDVTTYYLLHRHDFGLNDAPAGACILYAVSCNLSEADLADRYDILAKTGGTSENGDEPTDEEEADAEGESDEGTGSTFKLKAWKQRNRPGMGIDPAVDRARVRREREAELGQGWILGTQPPEQTIASRAIPLIDQVHRLMHLWRAGDQVRVDQYLEDRGLRRSQLFQQLLQALVELSPEASDERSVLESIMNHVRGLGAATVAPQKELGV